MGESWFNGNTSPCVIYIDRCVGLFLWAASTGPELYINFSLRTIYKHCYVLPIVHVPLTGNICLRMFKKSTKSIKCGGHFQMKQPMPISSPSFFWWSPSKVSRLWPVAGQGFNRLRNSVWDIVILPLQKRTKNSRTFNVDWLGLGSLKWMVIFIYSSGDFVYSSEAFYI